MDGVSVIAPPREEIGGFARVGGSTRHPAEIPRAHRRDNVVLATVPIAERHRDRYTLCLRNIRAAENGAKPQEHLGVDGSAVAVSKYRVSSRTSLVDRSHVTPSLSPEDVHDVAHAAVVPGPSRRRIRGYNDLSTSGDCDVQFLDGGMRLDRECWNAVDVSDPQVNEVRLEFAPQGGRLAQPVRRGGPADEVPAVGAPKQKPDADGVSPFAADITSPTLCGKQPPTPLSDRKPRGDARRVLGQSSTRKGAIDVIDRCSSPRLPRSSLLALVLVHRKFVIVGVPQPFIETGPDHADCFALLSGQWRIHGKKSRQERLHEAVGGPDLVRENAQQPQSGIGAGFVEDGKQLLLRPSSIVCDGRKNRPRNASSCSFDGTKVFCKDTRLHGNRTLELDEAGGAEASDGRFRRAHSEIGFREVQQTWQTKGNRLAIDPGLENVVRRALSNAKLGRTEGSSSLLSVMVIWPAVASSIRTS